MLGCWVSLEFHDYGFEWLKNELCTKHELRKFCDRELEGYGWFSRLLCAVLGTEGGLGLHKKGVSD